MFKTIKGVYGKNKLVDLETLEFYNVQLPTQIVVGIFMLLIENNDKIIVVKYATWRKEWQWWDINWDWIRKVSYLYGLV